MKFILGRKIGMTQVFDQEGRVIPVTVVSAGPCFITQIKTKDKDGYLALQLGYEKIEKAKKIKKTQKDKPFKVLKEVRIKEEEVSQFKVGDEVKVDIFKPGDIVDVSGTSKGKGFQGVVKRWGFSGRNATHGVKHEERTLGSVGSAFPQRVIKGKKMPGRMGNKRVTVKNLEIIKVDPENNLIAIKGALPGGKGSLVEIKGR